VVFLLRTGRSAFVGDWNACSEDGYRMLMYMIEMPYIASVSFMLPT